MTPRKELILKLNELVEFAKTNGEPKTAVIILALLGSITIEDEDNLIIKVNEYSRETIQKINNSIATQN